MKPDSVCAAWVPRLAVSFFLAVLVVTCELPAGEPPAADDLPAMCRAAKATFRPLTEADMQRVKSELAAAAARLDRKLAAAGENGADWRKYIQLDQAQTELARQQPDPAVLNKLYGKLLSGHEGLGLLWFVEVRQALEYYLETAASMDSPQAKAAYEELMEGLAPRLAAYAAKPSSEEALVIGRSLRWLEGTGQAPEVVAAVRKRLVHPNLFLEVSAGVIGAGIGGPVDDTRQICDFILGTGIYATAHTIGETTVELAPDPHHGVVDTIFLGVTNSQNVGYHGPVEIYSHATTRLGACKRLWVDAEGLNSLPAVSNATNEATITDICSIKGRRLVERLAWKRVGKQKCLAQSIAARHAEGRVNDRMDQEAGETLGGANRDFLAKFRNPLLQRKLFPQQLVFSTTRQALHVLTLDADRSQLGAPAAPPELVGQRDLAIRIHESMVNNFAASALGGMALREATFQSGVVDLLGELPERLKADDDREPWAITFARQQPISVNFADNGLKITLRGSRYFKGDESYPGMNVTAAYKIVKTPDGFNVVREGPLQIFPPGFVPEGEKKLTPRQVVIRKLLERRFSKIFEEELVGKGFVLRGKWSKAGKMRPVQMVSQDGWLTIAWQRETPEKSLAANP